MKSILPDIWEVARGHGLALAPVPSRTDEARADCPFCGDKKGHLYLNRAKQTFNCYRCGEHGGVARFKALLEGRSEHEVLRGLRRRGRKPALRHPALGLSTSQLRLAGFVPRPGWRAARREELDWLWEGWQAFLDAERTDALKLLYLGLSGGRYAEAVEAVARRGREIGHDLLKDCLAAFGPEPPAWARAARELAAVWLASTQRDAAKTA